MTKTRRLQVLIEDEQWERIQAVAQARGVSVATIVREAIDARVPGGAPERRAAAGEILDAPPMPVPDVDELLTELDALRARHA